jgi:hypothetical protein
VLQAHDANGRLEPLRKTPREQIPVNLDATWSGVSRGVYRLEDRFTVIMDIDRMLAGAGAGEAAAAA